MTVLFFLPGTISPGVACVPFEVLQVSYVSDTEQFLFLRYRYMPAQDSYLLLTRSSGKSLIPGKMPEIHFWLLVEVSPIRSEK